MWCSAGAALKDTYQREARPRLGLACGSVVARGSLRGRTAERSSSNVPHSSDGRGRFRFRREAPDEPLHPRCERGVHHLAQASRRSFAPSATNGQHRRICCARHTTCGKSSSSGVVRPGSRRAGNFGLRRQGPRIRRAGVLLFEKRRSDERDDAAEYGALRYQSKEEYQAYSVRHARVRPASHWSGSRPGNGSANGNAPKFSANRPDPKSPVTIALDLARLAKSHVVRAPTLL